MLLALPPRVPSGCHCFKGLFSLLDGCMHIHAASPAGIPQGLVQTWHACMHLELLQYERFENPQPRTARGSLWLLLFKELATFLDRGKFSEAGRSSWGCGWHVHTCVPACTLQVKTVIEAPRRSYLFSCKPHLLLLALVSGATSCCPACCAELVNLRIHEAIIVCQACTT